MIVRIIRFVNFVVSNTDMNLYAIFMIKAAQGDPQKVMLECDRKDMITGTYWMEVLFLTLFTCTSVDSQRMSMYNKDATLTLCTSQCRMSSEHK